VRSSPLAKDTCSDSIPGSESAELKHITDPRPCRAENLVLIGTDGNGDLVFLNPEGPGWAALTPSAASLLSMCDGTHTIPELENIFRSNEPATGNQSLVSRLVSTFHDCRLMETDHPHGALKIERQPLKYAALYLTRACNLSCRFCFFSAGRACEDELTTADYFRLIDQLAAMGVRTVYLMGGEPLLRKDVFDIACRAREQGLVASLVTNGTLLTKEVASRVARSFTFTQVSIDGLERANDAIRGKGGFQRSVEGIRRLLEQGGDVRVASVVSRYNVEELDDFLSFMVAIGIRTAHFINLQECGRGRQGRIGVTAQEFFRALLPVWYKWKDVLGRSNALNFLLPVRGFRKTHCGVGNGMVEIDSQGNVFGCYKYMETGGSAGNVREMSIQEIYDRSPVLNALRDKSVLDDPACRRCHFRFLCGGDCMAIDMIKGDAGELCEVADLFRWILTEAEIPDRRELVSSSDVYA
jgi:radical SAM protein with 4Fe4S-binding SPASM domain